MKMIVFLLLLISTSAFAGDSHQQGQAHEVTYVILDSSGEKVSGQTPGLAFMRASDGLYLDFSDGTFKSSAWTTRIVTMDYNSTDGFYKKTVSVDTTSNPLISGDYVVIVSNDDTTYRDTQTESVSFDNQTKLILINN